MIRTSFITANYVARALNFTGKDISEWGRFDQATLQSSTPDTFRDICADVSDAGFDCIDVWASHCHFLQHDHGDFLEQIKGWISQFDLTITSYAGGILADDLANVERAFRFMKQLGAPLFAGGIWGSTPWDEVLGFTDVLCEKLGLKWGYENHPEKSADEILGKIGHGRYKRIGVALDTGWCGTQGLNAVEMVKRIREKLFILHLKDVRAAGGHDTCVLGDGVVACEGVVRYLVDSKWEGTICIEHEPFNRDPMPEVKTSLQRVREWLG